MKKQEFVDKVNTYIHNENLINNPFRVMFDYVIEGRELHDGSLMNSMKRGIYANDVSKMLEDSHIEGRVKTEVIPAIEQFIKGNIHNSLNERSFIDKIMGMIFGPKDFGVSSGIVKGGVFENEINNLIGAKYFENFNTIIESINSLRYLNDKSIKMLKPLEQPRNFTDSMEYIENVMELVNTNELIEEGIYDYNRIEKFAESYEFILEMDGMNIISNWFKKPFDYIKKVTKNLYMKIKSYTKDTYTLNVDIQKLYEEKGDMKIMGRDGMNLMLDMPVSLFKSIADVSMEILEKSKVIYNNHGTSIDFDTTTQKIKKASNALDEHMKNKFVTTVGDNEMTFNHAVYLTYNRNSHGIIGITSDVYRRVMEIEKMLVDVKYSGDESKKNLYNDLEKIIDILKGVINLMESNFSQMFRKYKEVLTKVLSIAQNIKSDGSLDKVDKSAKDAQSVSHDNSDVSDDDDMDDDDYAEALGNEKYKYHFYEFVSSDTNNQIDQYYSEKYQELISADVEASFNKPLNESALPIADLNYVTYQVNEMKKGFNEFIQIFNETNEEIAFIKEDGEMITDSFIENLLSDVNDTDTNSLEEMNLIFKALKEASSVTAIPIGDLNLKEEEPKNIKKDSSVEVFVSAVNEVVDGESTAFIRFNDILKRTTANVKADKTKLERLYTSEYNIKSIVDILHNILKHTKINDDNTLSFSMLPDEAYNDIIETGGADELVFNYTAAEMREFSSFMFKLLSDKKYLGNLQLIKKTPGGAGNKIITLIAIVMKEINRII